MAKVGEMMPKRDKRLWRFADFERMVWLKKNKKTGGFTWLDFDFIKKK